MWRMFVQFRNPNMFLLRVVASLVWRVAVSLWERTDYHSGVYLSSKLSGILFNRTMFYHVWRRVPIRQLGDNPASNVWRCELSFEFYAKL